MVAVSVSRTWCEYKENPLGIDVAHPRFSWRIESDRRGVVQIAYQLQVALEDAEFAEVLWDTGEVHSDQSMHIVYQGPPLEARQGYAYRVRVSDGEGSWSDWSPTATFETGLMEHGAWTAQWISSSETGEGSVPCTMLRKTFAAGGKIKRARIYATSLGLYELRLNGARVGDGLLTPGWTSYHHRLQYQTYDVTPMLLTSSNTIGVLLGDGWYKGELGWEGHRELWGNQRAALMQLHIVYEDGNEQVIRTDGSWKTATGPILMSELYHGETYDARLEKEGWDRAGYDDSSWLPVVEIKHRKDILVAQENHPTRVMNELKPIGLFQTPVGDTVLDMGQNMVGWMHFKVRGQAGDIVKLQHFEVLDADGNVYTANLRKAQQRITYICRGEGEEQYEPHFTFQGFRYVKVEACPGEVRMEDFTGKVIHSAMELTGQFECSDPLINQLQHNIVWGQKGNFVDVPTDCPQRDERLGWTGDAQVFIRTASFNMNVAPFFTKWMRDLAADQLPDGGVPFVIPQVENNIPMHSATGWGDAAVICPWTIYMCYGDGRILEEQYPSMKAWINYIRSQGDNEYLWNTGFHFGDWLALDAKDGSYLGATSNDFVATAFYAYSTSLLVKAAEVLHKPEDAAHYRELHNHILKHFRQEFVTPNGRLSEATQTAYILSLAFDLLEESDRPRAARTLAQYLEVQTFPPKPEKEYALRTGFLGTPYLCHALSQNGYHDIACKLVLRTEYPSWLYPVNKGATTIWEHWDGLKEDDTFWSADMNSFNHYAYGAIGDWLYQVLA
ncbi:MAG: family 78 glycoside hydrolase catalytic domain, partial [Paenibacillaceae bacterium]